MMLGGFLGRVAALARKEAIHIVRDVRVVYLALGLPVVLIALFGYAVSFDLERLPIAVVDQDRTPASRRLVEAMTASDSFEVAARLTDASEVEPLFRQNALKAALVIPPDFGRQLARGEQAQAQLLLDGVDGVTTSIAMGYAAGISQAETRRLLEEAGLVLEPPISDRVRVRFNPGMRSARFIVPGLIAVILSIMAVLLTALTVAREWERGSMEQLFATPVRRLEVMLGKLLPYVGIGLVQTLLVLTVGAWLFDVPVVGSLWLLFGAALLFLTGMLGQGMLISVVTKNQQVATQIGMVSSMLPTLLLSGFLFPVENMPAFLQVLSMAIPGRYFIVVLRGILLKGNGVAVLWPQLGALAIFAVIMIGLCTARFKRRLD
ncbi:MAG: ABC transporter permease [Deltaproteobacteria bacterium]|jgi:ABC-2 type transport system permease protein|nr:ABC transporter permease [Deltaproteobacteria bacterium]MBW2531214.1 ABC transporter permease [Deltaproteobacteria bacterium]